MKFFWGQQFNLNSINILNEFLNILYEVQPLLYLFSVLLYK